MLETLILFGVGVWLVLALRSCFRHRGGCGCCDGCHGDCGHCKR